LQGVFQQSSANAFASPALIGGELTQQEAWHGIRRLASTDRTGSLSRDDRRRREAVIAYDMAVFMDNHDRRETFFLIAERTRLQPTVERGFATGEI